MSWYVSQNEDLVWNLREKENQRILVGTGHTWQDLFTSFLNPHVVGWIVSSQIHLLPEIQVLQEVSGGHAGGEQCTLSALIRETQWAWGGNVCKKERSPHHNATALCPGLHLQPSGRWEVSFCCSNPLWCAIMGNLSWPSMHAIPWYCVLFKS